MNQEQHRPAKHLSLRTCVVCREKENKRTLTRVVRTEQGVQIDPSGKMNGRGAYLCDRAGCWDRAVSGDALSRALRTTLTAEDRERLKRAQP